VTRRKVAIVLFVVGLAGPAVAAEGAVARVGSKAFTESVILGEMAVQLAKDAGFQAEHVEGLGGTRLLWEAIVAGKIDVYPEYTGTLTEEIFAGEGLSGDNELRERLARFGLKASPPLGFNNTYVLGMKEELAARRGIRTIGDLRGHGDLVLRFSNEFMKRADGWRSLARRYGLPQRDVRGLEHALAYEALEEGVIQVTDLYATDAKIEKLGLRRLQDDLGHFPRYDALFLYRAELEKRAPSWVDALRSLGGRLDETTMAALNARVELEGAGEATVASAFLARSLGTEVVIVERSIAREIGRYTLEHLHMVAVSLFWAVLVAVPLGVLAARRARLGQLVLGTVGVIQTIPAIALLVLLIRPVGWFSDELGYPQAVVALFLYSLLPIVRNTHAGLRTIPPPLSESAMALGLPPAARLFRVELPLASPTILAGIKTAAVINVGFATLGGFIGAGGFGEPIFTGIRLNDYGIILQGALPAALLAILVQGLFELLERTLVPKGLRLKPAS
jgi:osmoprotectant transport system permease protein